MLSLAKTSTAIAVCALLAGCGTPQSRLRYTALPQDGSDGPGFPFVVPRTVVKVEVSVDDKTGREKVTWTTIPVAYALEGGALPGFLAVDSSAAGFALTPTTITAAAYVDDLIIREIGTEVTDNRKEALDAVVSLGAVLIKTVPFDLRLSERASPSCPAPLKPLVLENFEVTEGRFPAAPCWQYRIAPSKHQRLGLKAYAIEGLHQEREPVSWFPVPACRLYEITVYRCGKEDACSADSPLAHKTVLPISLGTHFRKAPLPQKGSIKMNENFCVPSFTNSSTGQSDWSLLNQAIADVKAATK